jgi:glycerol-3-phosphate cytidylyltransferase
MKIGFTCSAFDLLHPGHIAMLQEAKTQCDYLIVGLHTNPQIDRPGKNKPVQTTYERWLQLAGCKYVNEVIPYDTEADLVNLLQILKPDVRILGEEYKEKQFTGYQLKIPLYFNTRKHTFSTTELRERLNKCTTS